MSFKIGGRLAILIISASSLIIVLINLGLAGQKKIARQEVRLTPSRQFQLFQKMLAFERSWKGKGISEVTIAILYEKNYELSRWTKEDFVAAISPETTIEGVPVRLVEFSVEEKAAWVDVLSQQKINFLYLTPLRPATVNSQIKGLLSLCRQFKVATFTGEVSYVDLGVAIGLGVENDTPHIFVNLRAAREQGLDLSARLLRMTSIR